ncbi:MAG: class I SAM-dependent methyltransferase [Candidatus Paceibacterota bacterium]
MEYKNNDLLDLYKLKVEEHWYTIYNPILKYLGDLRGKRILDLGCGSGELTVKLADSAKEVVGVDLSPEWIDHCNKTYHNNNLTFFTGDARNLDKLKDKHFDIVILNAVLPNIYMKAEVQKIFSEVRRVSKTSGTFIFTDVHPILKMTKQEGMRRQEYSKNFSYFKEGSKFSAIVILPNNKEIKFEDAHWSLSFYSDMIRENNFLLDKIIESSYPANAPKKFFRYSFPEYITFCCKKLNK